MLTDEEAAEVRKKLEDGWRGPVLLTWLYRLLDHREERVRWEKERAEPDCQKPSRKNKDHV